MLKTLYIIRHGETDYNKMGMVQGSGIDSPLNDTGLSQAAAFFNTYQDIPFEKIYVSNLQRTQQTVQGFIDLGIPFESLAGLREISWGIQEGKRFTPETLRQYEETYLEWGRGNYETKIEGGENPLEVQKRQKVAIQKILSSSGSPVLICTHGRAMRILLCWLLKHPLSYMDQFSHTNTCLYKLNFTGEQFSIELFNNTDHLEKVELPISEIF